MNKVLTALAVGLVISVISFAKTNYFSVSGRNEQTQPYCDAIGCGVDTYNYGFPFIYYVGTEYKAAPWSKADNTYYNLYQNCCGQGFRPISFVADVFVWSVFSYGVIHISRRYKIERR